MNQTRDRLLPRLARLCQAMLVCSVAMGLSAQTFRNPLRIPTPQDPSSINVADLNGDGHPDVLYGLATNITQQSTGTMHTLLWQPGGSYSAGPTLTLPADTNTLCRAGDLNGDGLPDLLCPSVKQKDGSLDAALVFFAGNGDGSFGTPVYSPVAQRGTFIATLFYPLISVFADLNRDGHLDVLVSDGQANLNYTMLGDGSGHFAFGSKAGYVNGAPQLIDINEDGILDMASANGLVVALGRGDGSFGNSSLGVMYSGCAYGDVDGDGHVDAACALAPGGSGLYILHGKGDGTFDPLPVSSTVYPTANGSGGGWAQLQSVLQIRDLNGDGVPDLIGTAGDGWTTILAQPGLKFAAPRHAAAGYQPGAFISSQLYPQYAVADLDGDRTPDLVLAGPNGVYISRSQAPLAQTPPEPIPVAEAGYRTGYVAVADFNGDGIPDIAASGSKDLTLSIGRGDGTFTAPVALANAGIDFSTPLSATRAYLLHGDFDGDGKQDLLAVGSPSIYVYNIYLLRGHGDGTFDPPSLIRVLGPFFHIADRSAFDINHDGKDDLLDIVTSSTKGSPAYISFALSAGNGTFQAVTTPITTESADSTYNRVASFPALADFDGDGKADVVYAYSDNAYVMPGNGDGTFQSARATKLALPGQAIATVYAVTTGDFDGDGHNDFAVLTSRADLASTFGSVLTLFYGNGDGTFAAPVQRSFAVHGYTDALAVDLGRDGLTDLLLTTGNTISESKGVALVHGRKDRTLGIESNYYAGGGISTMAVADLNRDGKPDLIFANGDYNLYADTVTVLLNVNDPSAVIGTLIADPEPSIAGQSFDLVATLQPTPATSVLGSVNFQVDGADVGSAAVSGSAARITVNGNLAVGGHTLGATWSGDADHAPLLLTGSHTVVAATNTPPAPIVTGTQITLTAFPNPAFQGQTVTVRATVRSVTFAGGPTPTGVIRFLDGSTVLAELAYPAGGGLVSITTAALAVGTHSLTATYLGDVNFTASTSAPVLQTILPSGFTLSTAPAALSLATGHHLTFTLKATSASAFADTLRFNTPSLPAHGTLTFTAGTATLPAGGSVSTSVYLDTSDVIGYLSQTRDRTAPVALAGLLAVPLGLLLVPQRRRTGGALLLLALAALCSAAMGCSGKYPASVTPGKYTLHLTATGQTSSTAQTLDVPLTVTP